MYRDFQRQESLENMNLQAQKYVPDEQAALAILQYLEREQLQQYLNDSSKIDEMIHDLDQVKGIQRERENIIVKNRSLAEFNLGLQPKLETLKQQVVNAYEEVNTLKVALCEDVAKLDSAPGCQSHDTLVAIFQTEAATADEQSEEVAEQFCDGSIDLEKFLAEYLPKRTESYIKKAKLEKVGDLLRQGGGGTNSVPYASSNVTQNYAKPYTNSANTGFNAGYGAGNTPYPNTSGPGPYGGMPLASYYQR